MDTAQIFLLIISVVGVLVFIGLILCLVVLGRVNKLAREMKSVYGQENDIKKRIEQYVAKKASDELSKMVLEYRERLDSQSQSLVEAMREGTVLHLESLKKFILGQEAQINKQTEYIVGAIVKRAQGEIQTYKENQMEGIDAEVQAIIDRVAPEVLGKTISLEDHEQLVWKALEKAKREGIFIKGVGGLKPEEVAKVAKVSKVSKVKGNRSNKRTKGGKEK